MFEFIVVSCEHDSTCGDCKAQCKKCFGTGKRYVPRGYTAELFDRLVEPLRMFMR